MTGFHRRENDIPYQPPKNKGIIGTGNLSNSISANMQLSDRLVNVTIKQKSDDVYGGLSQRQYMATNVGTKACCWKKDFSPTSVNGMTLP